MASDRTPKRRFRSRDWFDDPAHLDMVALYLERFMNYGLTADELRAHLEDVESVLSQAGLRQGLVRRSSSRPPDDEPPSRPRLRLIK